MPELIRMWPCRRPSSWVELEADLIKMRVEVGWREKESSGFLVRETATFSPFSAEFSRSGSVMVVFRTFRERSFSRHLELLARSGRVGLVRKSMNLKATLSGPIPSIVPESRERFSRRAIFRSYWRRENSAESLLNENFGIPFSSILAFLPWARRVDRENWRSSTLKWQPWQLVWAMSSRRMVNWEATNHLSIRTTAPASTPSPSPTINGFTPLATPPHF